MAKITEKLGELVFNGTILFFSISFGLLVFLFDKQKLSINDFNIIISLILTISLLGVLALILSFVGINNL